MTLQKNYSWVVLDNFDGVRVDYWLKKNFSNFSYIFICKIIRKGIVRVNGKRIKNSFLIKKDDQIKFSRNINFEENIYKKKFNYKEYSDLIKSWVVYKDKEIIALNKPSGIAVQGGTKISLNIDVILENLTFGLNEKPKLVHRLDKQTSGILILARNLLSAKYMGNLFKQRLIDKRYLAIVSGVPKKKTGRIDTPIFSGTKELEATTFYETIDTKSNVSLLLLKPETGRKHQIRKHLNLLNLPIIGETKFLRNKKKIIDKANSDFFLHAYTISFKGSKSNPIILTASLPEYFKKKIKVFNLNMMKLENKKF